MTYKPASSKLAAYYRNKNYKPVVVPTSYKPTVVRKDYGAWSRAYKVTVETFKKTIIEDTENVWVVAFVGDNCPTCHTLATEWEKLTKKTTITVRRVKFAYVNTDEEGSETIINKYCGGNKVQMTPTVLVYGKDKYHPTEYIGDYKTASMNKYICQKCDREGYGFNAKNYDAGVAVETTVTTDVDVERSSGRQVLQSKAPKSYYTYSQPLKTYSKPRYSYSKPATKKPSYLSYKRPTKSYSYSPSAVKKTSSSYGYGSSLEAPAKRYYSTAKPTVKNVPYGYSAKKATVAPVYKSTRSYPTKVYVEEPAYYSKPRVLSAYASSKKTRVEDVDYDKDTRAGRSTGGYSRTYTQQPAIRKTYVRKSAPVYKAPAYKAPVYKKSSTPTWRSSDRW